MVKYICQEGMQFCGPSSQFYAEPLCDDQSFKSPPPPPKSLQSGCVMLFISSFPASLSTYGPSGFMESVYKEK